MEGAMFKRESRKLRRDAIRDQLQTRNEQEIRMPSNNYRANTNQHEAEDSDRDRQGSYTRILKSNGTINQAYRRADDSSEQNSNMYRERQIMRTEKYYRTGQTFVKKYWTHSPSVEEYKDSDKHRMQSSTRNENTNVKIVPEKTGISNRFIYMDEISDIDKGNDKGDYSPTYKQNASHYATTAENRCYPLDRGNLKDSDKINRQQQCYYQDDFGQIGGADKRERRNCEDVIPDSTDMLEHVHGYTGNYGDIKLEDYRGNRNDTVKPKIERRCTDATYNIVPEEYREYHPRGQQWMEEERVRSETERNQKILQKLYEQNRQIEYEREIKEQEERQLVERIRRLQIAKDELRQKRTERERLEKEIQKKMELESLRTQRIVILKRQEERLSDQVGEEIRRKESIHDDTEKESTQFTKVEHNCNRSGFGKPKIPQFDGNDFKVWKIEVECIIKSGIYPEYLIAQTIRNSLKGHTRKVF
ncbi:golgin subfamily A member 6-like protein 22 [Ruditapes philippinarum]|uniref:golgin subfamily A member 6-like protein 22 n=1 Tax=Ruditapes philippinarum TaxID=129788 RepID=UPI00295B379E|nr:golgin subfamily A member 6-like protein 22 [Ruditapes philippinarum]